MIAMQYSFTLSADYDMAIIRRRIAEKGHLLDDFPGLAFKAYLHAAQSDGTLPSHENLYAPFYLWHDVEGMHGFLGGAGFSALTQAFGWPSIRLWSVWQAHMAEDLSGATCASRDILPIDAYSDLASLRGTETDAMRNDLADGALAAVNAFEPTSWTLVRFRLWPEQPVESSGAHRQIYRAGHVSRPGNPQERLGS